MVLLLFLLAVPIFFLFLLQKLRGEKLNTPPGPRGLPFIGNLHQFDKSAPYTCLWELSKTYGPLMSLQLGFVPTLIVSSAKMAKEVMKTHDIEFAGRPNFRGQQKLSYNGLDLAFAPYDDYWREMRKICVLQLFSIKRVQSFRPIREDEVSQMIKKISKLAAASKVSNLSEIILAFTSSLICRIAFSKRYDDEGTERSKFHDLMTESQAMIASFFLSDLFPVVGKMIDKVNGMSARLEKNFQEFDEFYEIIIKEHLDPKRKQMEQEDFLDVLLRLQKERLFTIDLTNNHIKAVLMNVFIAGTDTSAAMLVWAMTELIKNPKVMNKAQEEIRSTFGKKDFIEEEDIQMLPYLKAVVKEAFRMHPATALLVPHQTIKKTNVVGYDIQAETLVLVNAWAIGRDPECWENPEEFLPERFLGSSIDFKGQHFELIPFGAGRRSCPAISLGAAAVEISLANLLHSFDWELPPGMKKEDVDFSVSPGIAMHKKIPLCLMAKSRT